MLSSRSTTSFLSFWLTMSRSFDNSTFLIVPLTIWSLTGLPTWSPAGVPPTNSAMPSNAPTHANARPMTIPLGNLGPPHGHAPAPHRQAMLGCQPLSLSYRPLGDAILSDDVLNEKVPLLVEKWRRWWEGEEAGRAQGFGRAAGSGGIG